MALDTTIGGAAADFYGTAAAWATYTTSMGWTLLGDATSQDADMRRAAVYLDREYQWIGTKDTVTQALQWPRDVVDLDPDGFVIEDDIIPVPVINAQFEIAYLFNQGNDLLAFTSGAAVKREKAAAGPVSVETEYLDSGSAEARVVAVEGLLRGYIVGGQPGQTAGYVRMARG